MFKDTLAPIYEYERSGRPGCAIGGFYLDHLELYLFGDLYGTLWLLKKQKNGKWYLYHYYKIGNMQYGLLDMMKKQKIYSLLDQITFKLKISIEPIKLDSQVKLCRTTMPSGSKNNSGCQ